MVSTQVCLLFIVNFFRLFFRMDVSSDIRSPVCASIVSASFVVLCVCLRM